MALAYSSLKVLDKITPSSVPNAFILLSLGFSDAMKVAKAL